MTTKPLFKTIDDLMLENHIELSEDDACFYLKKYDNVIKISKTHKVYLKTLMRFFDIHFFAVENEKVNGLSVVDYSCSRKHKVIGFDKFEVYCPSLAETFDTVSQYLEYAKLKDGDVVLDLGSYSGLTSVVFAESVGKNGKVIAVEPDALNYSCLEKNVAQMEDSSNVECLNAAAWKETGKLSFSNENSMGSSAVSIVGERGLLNEVDCFTLNDMAAKYNLDKIDFIKCDIEGAEAYIFDDDNFFSKFKPRILVETHIVAGNFCDKLCIDALSKHGYSHKYISQNGLEMPLIVFEIE
jgi:FkbM family methyltransferase